MIIEDLSSTNGTLVNGIAEKRKVLVHLDDLNIGAYKITYSETWTAPASLPGTENVTGLTSIQPIINPVLHADYPGSSSETETTTESYGAGVAAIRVHSGSKAGSIVALEKAITTVGKNTGGMGAISKKQTGYYFLPVSASERSTVIKHNGKGLTPQVEIKLAGGDLLEIAGEHLEFLHPFKG